MMLPIFFHRRIRYSNNRKVHYNHFRRPGKKRWGIGCAIPLTILLLVTAALWSLWYYYPLSDEEQKESQTRLITETRYIISADTTDILAFTSSRGDSILEGTSNADAEKGASKVTDTVNAQWVRQWELLPYNGNNLMAEKFDTATICHLQHGDIVRLLRKQAGHIAQEQSIAKVQLSDVDYFQRTHTVLDNGFDIVAHYGQKLEKATKSLNDAAILVQKALKSKALKVRLERRYFLIADTTGKRIECIPTETHDSLLHLTLAEPYSQPGITSRLCKKSKALAMLKSRHSKLPKPKTSAIDSIGTYSGGRDSLALPHGYGRFTTLAGAYYEGEWMHGKRNGVGFSIIPGKRLRLGEWRNDKFLGERITYTPERIYGIDISRHQHERGRKRFSINWKDLRIISLGKMSRKVIHGKVDYPVRFVFIKATEGTTVRNRYFAADYAAARKYGYRTGAYHFFSIRTQGKQQAINFLRHSRYAKGDLPPVLDLEPTDAQIRQVGGIHALFRNVRNWLHTVENQLGVRPILYISQRFVNKYLSLAPDLHNNYDVWIARYGEYKPDVHLVYWQLSPDGRVNGIHGEVDINVYNGFNF